MGGAPRGGGERGDRVQEGSARALHHQSRRKEEVAREHVPGCPPSPGSPRAELIAGAASTRRRLWRGERPVPSAFAASSMLLTALMRAEPGSPMCGCPRRRARRRHRAAAPPPSRRPCRCRAAARPTAGDKVEVSTPIDDKRSAIAFERRGSRRSCRPSRRGRASTSASTTDCTWTSGSESTQLDRVGSSAPRRSRRRQRRRPAACTRRASSRCPPGSRVAHILRPPARPAAGRAFRVQRG